MILSSLPGIRKKSAIRWLGLLALVFLQVQAWGATQTFNATDVPKTIASSIFSTGAAVSSTLSVNTRGQTFIGRLRVSLWISTPYTPSLQISLKSPSGKTIYLTKYGWRYTTLETTKITSVGGVVSTEDSLKGYGFGKGAVVDLGNEGVNGVNQRVIFDDGAATSLFTVRSGVIPPKAYRAEVGTLSDVGGESVDGTWTLTVEPGYNIANWYISGVSAAVNAWSLHVDTPETHTWTGAGTDGKMTNPQNWYGYSVPKPGDGYAQLTFPDDAIKKNVECDLRGLVIKNMTVVDGYFFFPTVNGTGNSEQSTLTFAKNALLQTSGAVSVQSPPNAPSTLNNGGYLVPGGYYALRYYFDKDPGWQWGIINIPVSAVNLRGPIIISTSSGSGLTVSAGLGQAVQENPEIGFAALDGFETIPLPIPTKGSLQKKGDGDMYILGPSNYMGQTTISAGRMIINNTNSLGWTSVDVDDAGTDVNGGTLVLDFPNNTTWTVGVEKSSGERGLQLRGLGANGEGALVVNANKTVTINGKIAFAAPSTASTAGSLGDPMSADAVGLGAKSGGILNLNNVDVSLDTSGTFSHSPASIQVLGGGTTNWGIVTGASLVASGTGTICNMTAANCINGAGSTGAIYGGTLNFKAPGTVVVAAPNNTLNYVDTVASVVMGGGTLNIASTGTGQPGALLVSLGTLSSYDWETQPSVILGNYDFGATATMTVGSTDPLTSALTIGHVEIGRAANPTATPAIVAAAGRLLGTTTLNKGGSGNLNLTSQCTFTTGNVAVSNGGLLVNADITTDVSGTKGSVTLTGGFVGGTGTVRTLTVGATAGVDPGMPMVSAAPDSPNGANTGILTCSTVSFADTSYFVADISTELTGNVVVNNATANTVQTADRLVVSAGGAVNMSGFPRFRPIWRDLTNPAASLPPVTLINNKGSLPVVNGFYYIPEGSGITYKGSLLDSGANDVEMTVSGIIGFATGSGGINQPDANANYTVPELIMPQASLSTARLVLSSSASGAGTQVSYTSVDGTARSGIDFGSFLRYYPGTNILAPVTGTITSLASTIDVDMIYNMTPQPSRSFKVSLFSPTAGLCLRYPFDARVTITDINFQEDRKDSACGMSSGFAVLVLLALGMFRMLAVRRRD